MKDKINQQERLVKKSKPSITKEEKYFLGGLFEGDGSFYVILKRKESSKFKLYIDPGIAIYQHQQGYILLERASLLFNCGKIEQKPDSDNVYQFVIANRRSLMEKVIPFYKKYVYPFSAKKESFNVFLEIVEGLERKDHHNLEGMKELVRKVYLMDTEFN